MTDRYEVLQELLREVNKGVHDLVGQIAGEAGLGVAGMIILGQLHAQPGSSVSELSRAAGLAKSHVSTTVEHLALLGFVEKRHDLHDLRLVRIWPTKRADDQSEAINEAIRQRLHAALFCLPDQQVNAMIAGLQALRARLAAKELATARSAPPAEEK